MLYLYLDFDGHQELQYPRGGDCYIDLDILPFDTSYDPNAPEEILRRVTEDFAPFDAKVTITEPNGIEQGIDVGIRVVIGGTQGDLDCPQGGSPVGVSADCRNSNTVVVVQFFADGTPRSNKDIAQTASHEVAHMLGFCVNMPLSHYTEPAHYTIPGQTPILGVHNPNDRDVWFKHDNVCLSLDIMTGDCNWGPQDDIAALAEALGMKRNDHFVSTSIGGEWSRQFRHARPHKLRDFVQIFFIPARMVPATRPGHLTFFGGTGG